MFVDWEDMMEEYVQFCEVMIFFKFKNNCNFCCLCEEIWVSNFDDFKNID